MALGVGVCCSLGGVAAHGGAEQPSMSHVTMASCDTCIIITRPVWSGSGLGVVWEWSGEIMCGGACVWSLTELWAATQLCDPHLGSGCASLTLTEL